MQRSSIITIIKLTNMKKFLLLLCFLASESAVQAQYFHYFPSGLLFPDATYYHLSTSDSSGHFYGHADEGKTLFVMRFALSDTAAWNFHNTGALQDLYAQYGPEGTGEVDIIMMPGGVSQGNLDGSNPNSAGNWLANMPYPYLYGSLYLDGIILHSPVKPLLYCICPDKRAFRVPFVSTDSLATFIGKCGAATTTHDAKIVQLDMDTTASCAGQWRTMDAYLSKFFYQQIQTLRTMRYNWF
jgi:hypothetical protein